MATFKQEDSPVDLGRYFNLDQAASASQAQRGKTVVSPQHFVAPTAQNPLLRPQRVSQQTFQGPSHQYELFRQHTSLAPGAFQNAVHPPSHMLQQSGGHNYAIDSNSIPVFDIGEADTAYPSMDMDFDGLFSNPSLEGFIDPNSIATGSDSGDISPVAQPIQRLWPGMHQQQAAAAKAEQQRRLEQQRLQDHQKQLMQQHQQHQLASQHQMQHPQGHQRRPSTGRNKPTDPALEERISQIMKSIRAASQQSRSATSNTPQPVTSQTARQRKEEEDMDDDERLLASEEGKKLTSKERRQLRNKVSARAFRSRRKEYITQLEGEIAAKASEADDLRTDNEALRAENAQLTDLVRMLLRHSAFQDVVDDLAAHGSQVPFVPSQNIPSQNIQPRPQPSCSQTTEAPTQPSSQPTSNAMDLSSAPMDGWNSGIAPTDFDFNPSIFAVIELPDPPVLSTETLSGKNESMEFVTMCRAEKVGMPMIEQPSAVKVDFPEVNAAPIQTVSSDQDPQLFALFDELPSHHETLSAVQSAETAAGWADIFGNITITKALGGLELVSHRQVADPDAVLMTRFSVLIKRLDAVSERIAGVTGHM